MMKHILLSIDLSSKKIERKEIPPEHIRKFIGGRGLAAYYLLKNLKPDADPLGEENIIYIMAGALSGYMVPLSGRSQIVTKSPLTGAITSSNVGGNFAFELKMAGYHGIEIKGKLEKPGFLLIYDDTVEIIEDEDAFMLSSHDADLYFRKKTIESASTMTIGPAGALKSRISALMVDGHRAAGRGGVGAMLGSKNLKGIVVKGTKLLNAEDYGKFHEKAQTILEKFKESPAKKAFSTYGTTGVLAIINGIGSLPYKNFHDGYCPHGDKINHETYNKTILLRNGACASCPLGCGRITKAEGKKGHGPEYEIVWAFGSSCNIDNLEKVAILNYLANEYGYDGISLGGTIAALMDLYEAGIVKESDIGFSIPFGDAEAAIRAVELMKTGAGIGKLLNEGSYRLSEASGHPEFSMSVKKQELPAYDPRGIKGMGLAYATNTRGGDHTKAFTVTLEVYQAKDPNYRLTYEGKHEIVKYLQDYQSIVDSTGTCSFGRSTYTIDIYRDLLNLLYGFDYTDDELLRAGERIWNTEKLFNLREGLTKEDDTIPERLFTEPIKNGPSAGELYDKKEFERLLSEYYKIRGWDEYGIPTLEKLEELGLDNE